MRIDMAHLRHGGISFAVFAANARTNCDRDRETLLRQLWRTAEAQGLRVQKAALAFSSGRQIRYYGTPDLVRFLASSGLPRWTHQLTV